MLALAVAAVALGPAGQAGADGYRVRPGDTLSGVAQRLGVGQGSLAAANDIGDPDRIIAGQVLSMPWEVRAGSRPAGASAAPASSYRVRPGDTLSAIAPRVGVSRSRLAAANGIADPDHVVAGRVLVVPGGADDGRPRAAATGPATTTRWRCPVPGARFVNDYGYVKPNGQRHAGIDLFAPRGTPVVAPVPGVVAPLPNRLGGTALTLQGDDGNRYYGAHLERMGRTGRVAAGAVIGYVGNSGDARGSPPHLHLEMRPAGGADASPYHRLTAAC